MKSFKSLLNEPCVFIVELLNPKNYFPFSFDTFIDGIDYELALGRYRTHKFISAVVAI